MASSVANVYASMPKSTGAFFKAPLGTAGPTNATDPLDIAFLDMGYIGEDGITESNTRDIEKKKAFGGATVKVLQTDYTATLKLTFLEAANAEVLKSIFGASNVVISGGNITVKKNKKPLPHESYVLDTIDDAVGSIRTYVPDGQIIEVGDITKVHTEVISYEVTIECFENAVGDNIIEFQAKNASAAAAPTISQLQPTSVAAAGGDLVQVAGTGFTGVTAVEVDGTPVAEYTVISPTLLVFSAPAHAAGTAPVTVVYATGESAGVNLTYA